MGKLILGNGLLGSEIHNITGWDILSRKENGIDFNNTDSFLKYLVDCTDISNYKKTGYNLKYDTVINCIANTDAYTDNAKATIDTNYVSVGKLVDVCNKFGIKLVHISTEFVYANNSNVPSEKDIPIPVFNWYGVSKLLGDLFIEANSKNYLICRLLHKQKGLNYKEVWKAKTSGDTVDKIAMLVVKLIEKEAIGVYNVGTGDKYLKEFIKAEKEIPAPKHVPDDTRMNITKLEKFLNETV